MYSRYVSTCCRRGGTREEYEEGHINLVGMSVGMQAHLTGDVENKYDEYLHD